MRQSLNSNGVYAAQSEQYKLPIESQKQYQTADRAWWAHPLVIVFLTIVFSLMDALVLYSILDMATTQSELLGYVMSFGIALVLNVIPLLVAKFIKQAIYGLTRYAAVWAAVCLVAFTTLYAGTVYLRFAYQDVYETEHTAQLTNTVTETGDEYEEAKAQKEAEMQAEAEEKSLAVVVLLSLEPLATSLANFALAYLADDEVKKRIDLLEIRNLELYEVTSDLKAAIETMEFEKESMIEREGQYLEAAKQKIYAEAESMEADARYWLSEHLADPTATSKLSQEKLVQTNA